MKNFRVALAVLLLACAINAATAQEFLDRLDQSLSFTAFHDNVRARVSGLLDLEGYYFTQPPPALIIADSNTLFNPRLSLFFDAQAGSHLYFFVQSRFDRGFDPANHGTQVRLDEYAIRFTPWEDGRLNLQVGKFSTVVGNWVERHQSWENPFINAPLPYENLTRVEDNKAPSYGYFTAGPFDEKYKYNPVIWGPSYATGFSVAGRLGQFDYAAEMKNASLSSRPESWNAIDSGFDHPTFSGRLGFRPNQMWNFGFSASDGAYFRPEAAATLPPGRDIGDYHQRLLGQDIGFAWHHIQLWAEFYEARFEIPGVGDADTFAYYFEGKYKFTPQFFGALRWNQQLFANVPNGFGGSAPWGNDLWRIDFAGGYRFTTHTQLKIQYSLQHETNGPRDFGHLLAAQFTVRF
ncbi:MAG TPA: hypothetical protein VGI42_02345 [Chthoniobacterales bacterium]|jgi:hypothetical protein